MKRLLWIPFLLFASFTMACCGGSKEPFTPELPGQPENPDGGDDNEPVTPTPGSNGHYLVLYASRTSNTERVAQFIHSTLDCDILKVEPELPYDNDYNAMLERAQKELAAILQGDYPPVKTSVKNFDEYDLIFVGYPIWYSSMATPMQAFLYAHASKLVGKRIALFATSGSSGISSSVGEARSLCPDATVMAQTLLLTSSAFDQMATRIPAWLDEIGAKREETNEPETPNVTSLKVNITVGDRTITATMEDNAASRDFLSRLPLEVTLNDYNNTTEKIFYPNPALTTEDVASGCAPIPGDITIYAPWSNVAIFCKSWSYSNDLIKIGRIDADGIDALNVGGDITVKFERQ